MSFQLIHTAADPSESSVGDFSGYYVPQPLHPVIVEDEYGREICRSVVLILPAPHCPNMCHPQCWLSGWPRFPRALLRTRERALPRRQQCKRLPAYAFFAP